MTSLRDRFTCVLVCAALVVCIAGASGAQGLSPQHKPSPFSIEKGKAGLDTSQVAPKKPATAAKTATAPVEKPALVKAEEALDNNRPKEAVDFAVQAVKDEPDSGHAWFVLGRAQQAAGNTTAAIAAGEKASTFASVRASALYNLACVYALNQDKDNAFKALANAKRAGFADRDQMMKDPDLVSLRGDKRFQLPGECNYFTLKLKDGKTELPFAVYLPVGYDPARPYPVLVAPGQGKKIKDNWGGLFWGEDTSQRGWIAVESPALLLEDPIGATRAGRASGSRAGSRSHPGVR